MLGLILGYVVAAPMESLCTANKGTCYHPSEGKCGKAVLNGLCSDAVFKCCADIPALADPRDIEGECKAAMGTCSIPSSADFCVSGVALRKGCVGGSVCCAHYPDYTGFEDEDDIGGLCSGNGGRCMLDTDLNQDTVPLSGLCTGSKTCRAPIANNQILELHYSIPSQVKLFPDSKRSQALTVTLKAMIYLDKRHLGKKMPVVVLAHGNHRAGEKSYLGYGYLGAHLARRGLAAISIDFDDSQISGSPSMFYLRDPVARANLMLEHLKAIGRTITDIDGVDVSQSMDMGNIGLLGHSRGGDAIKKLYQTLESNHRMNKLLEYQVKGVFQVANTDFSLAESSAAQYNVPWTGLIPSCDGDVYSFNAVTVFERLRKFGGQFRRNLITVVGANHNYYNTRWLESDVFATREGLCPSFLGRLGKSEEAGRIPSQVSFKQQESLILYATDFFEKAFAGKDTDLRSIKSVHFKSFVQTYNPAKSIELFDGINEHQVTLHSATFRTADYDSDLAFSKRIVIVAWDSKASFMDIAVNGKGPIKLLELDVGFSDNCYEGKCTPPPIIDVSIGTTSGWKTLQSSITIVNDELPQRTKSSETHVLLQTLQLPMPAEINDISQIIFIRVSFMTSSGYVMIGNIRAAQ